MNSTLKVTGVVFSKDRALQLDALLSSFRKYCLDNEYVDLNVLYKTTSKKHQRQYEQLTIDYPDVSFIKETKFKTNLLEIIEDSKLILFLVDDNLFYQQFKIQSSIDALSGNEDSIGFSFRLGKNITYCYMHQKGQKLPTHKNIKQNQIKFDWSNSYLDFGYPLEVSSSLYRTSNILQLMYDLHYDNPNTLELGFDQVKKYFLETMPEIICFKKSVAFCNPINIVQTSWSNRSGSKISYNIEFLSEKFEQGYRIDIDNYEKSDIKSCHQEVPIYFISPVENHISVTDNAPIISIVITTYNRSHFLAESLSSAINQTFPATEIIVVDDGSTDDTREVVNNFRENTIRYIKNSVNLGRPEARNRGILEAKGKYILWLDDDDVMEPMIVEEYHKIIDMIPNINLIYGKLRYFGNTKNIEVDFFDPLDFSKVNGSLIGHLITGCKIPNPCSLVKKELYQEVGEYDVEFERAEDYDFWVRASSRLVPYKADMVVCRYRWHDDNASFSECMEYSYESKIVRKIIEKWDPEVIFPDLKKVSKNDLNDEFHKRVGQIFLKYHDYHNALRYLLKISRRNMNEPIFRLVLRCCLNLGREKFIFRLLNNSGFYYLDEKYKNNVGITIESYNNTVNEIKKLIDDYKIERAGDKVITAIRNFDINSDLMCLLGVLAKRIGKHPECEKYLLKAVQCNPDNDIVFQNSFNYVQNEKYRKKLRSLRERMLL